MKAGLRSRTKLSTVAVALLVALSVGSASPASAAGIFALAEGYYVAAPPVVYPGMAAPVSVGLANTSSTTDASVTVSFRVICNNAWPRPQADGPTVTVTVPADKTRPVGAEELARATSVVPVPLDCAPVAGGTTSPDGYFYVTISQTGSPDYQKTAPFYVEPISPGD